MYLSCGRCSSSMGSSCSLPSSTTLELSSSFTGVSPSSKPPSVDSSAVESLGATLGTGEGPTGDSTGTGIPSSSFTISTRGSSVQTL